MKLLFLTVDGSQEDWSEIFRLKYEKKINYFTEFEFLSIKPNKNSRAKAEQKKQDYSDKILKSLKPEDYVVLFDEKGQKLNSIQFSKKADWILSSGKKRCVFIIGGSFGVSDEIKKRAHLQISFSDMVFNHLIAQSVALEQIYRAFTIIKGLPYHNA